MRCGRGRQHAVGGPRRKAAARLGHATRVTIDGAGLPVEVTDPLGATTRTTWDAFGRQIIMKTDAL
ncbi:RHS repeat domain-containing protein [Streptomyces sp. NPDC048272]|uniref:RHS repeat domain-containing protein n=1 Tax=Streptomyces sp. NPDC048272 TaxID=3154616 RepID=UPI00342C7A73